ncbi:MAG: ABC transporter ATP-binding protein [Candidatus Nanoperiomorbaceae bacterium]
MKRPADQKQMSLREQIVAIARVARVSFLGAPGAVIFKLVGSVISALTPIATAYFASLTTTELVAAFGGNKAAGQLAITFVIITVLLGLFRTVWTSIDQYIQASMRYRIEAKVSDQMYEKFLDLEFWRYDDQATIDSYDKAQKFTQFFAWIFDRLASLITQLITVIASVGALIFLNGWLALIIILAIIPSVYLQLKLSRMQIANWDSNVETRLTKGMIESSLLQPKSVTELRLYGIGQHLLHLRAQLRDKDEKSRIDFERKFIPKRLASDALQMATETGALIWVVLEIIARHQPVGQFIYVQQVVSRAIDGASSFVSQLSTISEDVANLFDYEQFMKTKPPRRRDHDQLSAPEQIEIKHVSFHYPTNQQLALSDVSLTIKRHQHIAIVGENGAGKSTLIKLLIGLYEPGIGEIKLDDQSLSDIELNSWHNQIAVLGQDFTRYVFTTARENVLFGDVKKRDAALFDSALTDAEARKFVDKLPNGLDTIMNTWMSDKDAKSGVDLSGGQW